MNDSQRKVIKETKLMGMILLFFIIIFPFLTEYPYLKYSFLALLIFAPRDTEIRERGIVDAIVLRYPLFKYYLLGYMGLIALWVFNTLKQSAQLSHDERPGRAEYIWVVAGLIIPTLIAGQFYKYEKACNAKT